MDGSGKGEEMKEVTKIVLLDNGIPFTCLVFIGYLFWVAFTPTTFNLWRWTDLLMVGFIVDMAVKLFTSEGKK